MRGYGFGSTAIQPWTGMPHRIYYSGGVCNTVAEGATTVNPKCEFNATQGTIVPAVEYYDLIIARLQINGALDLPIWQPTIWRDQSWTGLPWDKNLTTVGVTVTARWKGQFAPQANLTVTAGVNDVVYARVLDASGHSWPMAGAGAGFGICAVTIAPGVYAFGGAPFVAALNAAFAAALGPAWTAGSAWSWTAVADPAGQGCLKLTLAAVGTYTAAARIQILFDYVGQADAPKRAVNYLFGNKMGARVAQTYGGSQVLNGWPCTEDALTTWVSTPSQQYLMWEPEDRSVLEPPSPSAGVTVWQQISCTYYNCYSFDHFVKLFNRALTAAQADITTQFAAWWTANSGGVGLITLNTGAIELQYNETLGTFSMYGPVTGFSNSDAFNTGRVDSINETGTFQAGLAGPLAGEAWQVALNETAYGMLSSFPVVSQPVPDPYGREYLLNWFQAPTGTSSSGVSCYVLAQAYAATNTGWSQIGSIAIQSSTLAPVKQLTAPTTDIGTSSIGGLTSNTASLSAFLDIVTDFSLPLSTAADYRTQITLVPAGEYRRISLNGTGPITQLDLTVGWVHAVTGVFTPLTMPPNSNFQFLLLWEMKAEYRNSSGT